ncbi:MAG: hypothetical protein ABSB01_17660 [Streptosporangiaceae bacterium]
MSRLIMLPCAAFLRVYEPLSAFGPAERARWEAYATAASRPRRAESLEAERIEALRRIIALPPIVAPAQESPHAYVRWADGITYVCPWQTRLRSWLALGRLRATAAPLLADAFAPRQAQQAAEDFVRWEEKEVPSRVYIQSSTWSVPQAWFVPFAPTERWLVVGSAAERDGKGPATASGTRTLSYATTMAQARRRVARALAAIRRASAPKPKGRAIGPAPGDGAPATIAMIRVSGELEEVGRWLEEFHPHSLVELDYGGLVQLLDDDALRADQSVAEVAAAFSALAGQEYELATAMYKRLRARWRNLEAIQLGS